MLMLPVGVTNNILRLLSSTRTTDENERTALHYAVEGGHLNVVRYLVKQVAGIEASGA